MRQNVVVGAKNLVAIFTLFVFPIVNTSIISIRGGTIATQPSLKARFLFVLACLCLQSLRTKIWSAAIFSVGFLFS